MDNKIVDDHQTLNTIIVKITDGTRKKKIFGFCIALSITCIVNPICNNVFNGKG